MTSRLTRIVHRTEFGFDEWADGCRVTCLLRPRFRPGQVCVDHHVTTLPPSSRRSLSEDAFGNPVHAFDIAGRLGRLVVSSTATVSTGPTEPDAAPLSDTDRARLLATDAIVPDRATWDACRALGDRLGSGAADHDWLAALCRRLHEMVTYDPSVTEVGRPVARILSERRGMCQDHARLAVAVLRACQVPARYVVGYAIPPPMTAQDFLWCHAWVSAWLPGVGWCDADATDGRGRADDLITLAWGADFDDVNPVAGTLGSAVGRQRLDVAIRIEALD